MASRVVTAKAAEVPQDPTPVTRRGGGKRIIILIVGVLFVVLALAGAAYFFKDAIFGKSSGKAGNEKAVVASQSYVEMEPPFIVNLDDVPKERLLRVSISLRVRDKAVSTLLETHKPMIRNGVLLTLAAQNARALLTAEGKAKLQAALLKEVQKMYGDLAGTQSQPGIIDLFFTDFVMQ